MFTTHQYKKAGLDRGRERLKKAKEKLEKDDHFERGATIQNRRSTRNKNKLNSAINAANRRKYSWDSDDKVAFDGLLGNSSTSTSNLMSGVSSDKRPRSSSSGFESVKRNSLTNSISLKSMDRYSDRQTNAISLSSSLSRKQSSTFRLEQQGLARGALRPSYVKQVAQTTPTATISTNTSDRSKATRNSASAFLDNAFVHSDNASSYNKLDNNNESDNDSDTDSDSDDGHPYEDNNKFLSTGFAPSERRKRRSKLREKLDYANQNSQSWKTALFSCGSNHSSQLAHSKKKGIPFVPNLCRVGVSQVVNHITSICSGGTSTFFITHAQDVHCWGTGPLGGADTRQNSTKSSANMSEAWKSTCQIPTKIPNLKHVSVVSAGLAHAAAITNSGIIFTWGLGSNGRLGHGDEHNRPWPTKLTISEEHFSDNKTQTTGDAHTQSCVFDVSCGERHTLILVEKSVMEEKNSGSGAGGFGWVPPANSEEAKALNGVRTGVLMAFGSNKGGQLGTGDIVNRLSPAEVTCAAWRRGAAVCQVSAGMHHTLAVAVVGNANIHPVKRRVYAWGWGEHGRLGVGHEEMQASPTEVAILSHRNVMQICAGEQHSLARTAGGDVYSWGNNKFGQLGLCLNGVNLPCNLLPQKLDGFGDEEGDEIVSVCAGSRHSGVVTKGGRVYIWGYGEEGQLGDNSEKSNPNPRILNYPDINSVPGCVKELALGISHTVILVENEGAVGGKIRPVALVNETKPSPKEVKHDVVKEKEDNLKKEEVKRMQDEFLKEQLKIEEAKIAANRKRQEENERLFERQLKLRREKEAITMKKFELRKQRKIEVDLKKEAKMVVTPTSLVDDTPRELTTSEEASVNSESKDDNNEESEPVAEEVVVTFRPTTPSNVSFGKKQSYDQIYYHPDQPVEKCFVANTARRSLARKALKSGGGARAKDNTAYLTNGTGVRGNGAKHFLQIDNAENEVVGERPRTPSILRNKLTSQQVDTNNSNALAQLRQKNVGARKGSGRPKRNSS